MAILLFLLQLACKENSQIASSTYNYIAPRYDLLQVATVSDTITFPLDEYTYNVIKSFNVFSANGKEYMSFYDDRSKSINIYLFHSKKLIKKIRLRKSFRGKELYKTTVYTKNFDSLFVTNNTTLYLLDSSGQIKKSLDFLLKPPLAWAAFENSSPVIFKDNLLYARVRPYVNRKSFSALQKWKVLYAFDLQNNKAVLNYHLPVTYQEHLYGLHYLDYNYCYNDRGNFVFSFPADTVIYETNLADYHKSYFAKSQFQVSTIPPVTKEEISNDEGFKNYLTHNSYGPVYFDPFTRRYLRAAKSGITEADYLTKKRVRKQHLLILDEHFEIIGESTMNDEISLDSIFFTEDGGIYVRAQLGDEYAIHFVKLAYQEKSNEQIQISKK